MSPSNQQTDTPPKLIYIGDPMCSWCYGLSDELSTVIKHFEGQVDVEFIMGGLRPYYEVPMIEMKDFLTGHWQEVHEASGQEFTYGILDRKDLNYDTEPPCRAVVVMKSLAPSHVPDFFKSVQKTFYFHNKDMNQASSYEACLEGTGIDIQTFTKAFNSDEMKALVKKDFERSAELGVRSFPTILLEVNGEHKLIAAGYAKSATIIQKLNLVLDK